jgi:hypothetical protein
MAVLFIIRLALFLLIICFKSAESAKILVCCGISEEHLDNLLTFANDLNQTTNQIYIAQSVNIQSHHGFDTLKFKSTKEEES